MPKLRADTIEARIYERCRGAAPRYYADFRDFADVGGRQEPLVATGERYATTDYEEAKRLAKARLKELEDKRANATALTGETSERTFDALVPIHLRMKAKNKACGGQWLSAVQGHLETAAAFFGSRRDLATITPKDVSEYRAYLERLPNGRGGTLRSGTIQQYLNSLSNLFRRAQERMLVPVGYNPVSAIMERPKIERELTPWLEVHEMAEVLRFAFEEYEPERGDLAVPYFPVILATYALTGLRNSE